MLPILGIGFQWLSIYLGDPPLRAFLIGFARRPPPPPPL